MSKKAIKKRILMLPVVMIVVAFFWPGVQKQIGRILFLKVKSLNLIRFFLTARQTS